MVRNENEKYELVGEVVSIYRRAGSKKWYAYLRIDGRPMRRSLGTEHAGKARKLAFGARKPYLGRQPCGAS
ncbi:hypothetical protein I41_44090 [Lacipirellula limnantheis]|uniref:Integrase DNA-binding domain-containing protein n=1 Tax=Lacipirellula limnantheis TaxID=2528024 RepID=A0A517U3J7_9BACT|nr:hypothetical protein I41_44090 [Lacipirellula limnantheis]